MNKLIKTDVWELRCPIAKTIRPADSFHLKLQTKLLTSSHPDEWVTRLSATFTRPEMTKFRDVIDLHLAEFKEPTEITGAPV